MKKTWIVLDVSAICYAAFFAMPTLSAEEIPTTVLYGFFKQLQSLAGKFQSKNFVFCFDYGASIRKRYYRKYKANRHVDLTEEEQRSRQLIFDQMELLRTDFLPRLGYKNILFREGYEGDDMIAVAVKAKVGPDDDFVIVSRDKDLLQCLDDNVVWYTSNRGKEEIYNKKSFMREFGIEPIEFAKVKALAGCKSDNVPGIPGVGEKTALKWLRGELNPDTATYMRIRDFLVEEKKLFRKFRYVTILPFPTLKMEVELVEDEFNAEVWAKLSKRYHFNSFRRKGTRVERVGGFWK